MVFMKEVSRDQRLELNRDLEHVDRYIHIGVEHLDDIIHTSPARSQNQTSTSYSMLLILKLTVDHRHTIHFPHLPGLSLCDA